MIKQVFIFSCAKPDCDTKHTQTYNIVLGNVAVKPGPPDGWTVVDFVLYCPLHIVKVETIIE